MSLLSRIFSAFNPITKAVKAVKHIARFDAAQTTADNRRHWANADALSADAAANPAVRAILRNRCRYETANNGYLKGILKTHANFVIGTGPRLQMQTDNPALNRFIEQAFQSWSKKVRLAKKLRTLRTTKAESGEAFGLLTNNSKLKHPVQLDVRLIEADRVRSNMLTPLSPKYVDGIVFDDDRNPISYHVLKGHPGGLNTFTDLAAFDEIPAAKMLHLYEWDRPEQSRGVPEIASSLPLFAQLRRYTLAVVAAAETAADHAGVMQTTGPANPDEDTPSVEMGATMEIESRMLTALPEGWTLAQMKAEQPTNTYPDFKNEIINEASRPLNMPFNIAACNSSKYNYSSGRLDHQVYFKSIDIEQSDIEIEILDRILEEWLNEAALIEGYLPQAARKANVELPHQWFWDGVGHVDPQKDANAQETRLRNHTSTLADEYGKEGKDWEVQVRQRAKELSLMRELNVPYEVPASTETIAAKADAEDGAVDE
jgi:lambda family phage portal protein